MTTRQITPHKGGRTIKVSSDVTPEVHQMLKYLWQHHKVSLGDIIDQAAKEVYAERKEMSGES